MTPGAGPSLTVVVPVRDGADLLARLLDGVVPQLREGDEVVVVDDGSTDDTGPRARAAGAQVVVLPTSLGPYAARNAGVATCTTDGVVFTDVRCRVRPGWLEGHRRRLGTQALSFGAVEIEDLGTPASRAARVLDFFALEQYLRSPLGPYFPTCNLGVRRADFEAVGGFPAVRSGGDAALCRAVRERGGRHALEPRALMSWEPRRTGAQLSGQFARYGESSAEQLDPRSRRRHQLHRWVRMPVNIPFLAVRALRRYPTHPAVAATLVRALWANEVAYTRAVVRLRRTPVEAPGPQGVGGRPSHG